MACWYPQQLTPVTLSTHLLLSTYVPREPRACLAHEALSACVSLSEHPWLFLE